MRKSQRRRLFNLFAFALLAFVIYMIVSHKDEDALQNSQPAGSEVMASQQNTALQAH